MTATLDDVNPYVHSFTSLLVCRMRNYEPPEFQAVILKALLPQSQHIRRNSCPRASAIAAVISNAVNGIVERDDILLRQRDSLEDNENNMLDTISGSHSLNDYLIYVLFLPFGQDG